MNQIQALTDKSDYALFDDYLNFQIDGYWLDEQLEEQCRDNRYRSLIPTLLFSLEGEWEKEIVWHRILPAEKAICPILMCPVDQDFSCTLVVAEIENCGQSIKWSRIGVDKTAGPEPGTVGSAVEWLDNLGPFEFTVEEYLAMLQHFKAQFQLEQKESEERTQLLQEGFSKRASSTP